MGGFQYRDLRFGRQRSLDQVRLTCADSAFGWYGNNNATGVTINIDGATCQPNGAFGIGYNLTGGNLGGGSSRLDMGSSGGFHSHITSLASGTTSVVNPGGNEILFHTDSGQTTYTFTTVLGTTPSGIDLNVQVPIWWTPASTSRSGLKWNAVWMKHGNAFRIVW